MREKYLELAAHYESCLQEHGDTHRGVDWPNAEDAETRYRVMLEVVNSDRPEQVSLLDFGCGAAHLYEYIQREKRNFITYAGLDISEKFIRLSKAKFPDVQFFCGDILKDANIIPMFDYVVLNGVFTEKRALSQDEMRTFLHKVITNVFVKSRKGIAFNVMSKQVDWEREDLFHLSFDELASFLVNHVSRNFVFRQDYGLYEYTTYVYK